MRYRSSLRRSDAKRTRSLSSVCPQTINLTRNGLCPLGVGVLVGCTNLSQLGRPPSGRALMCDRGTFYQHSRVDTTRLSQSAARSLRLATRALDLYGMLRDTNYPPTPRSIKHLTAIFAPSTPGEVPESQLALQLNTTSQYPFCPSPPVSKYLIFTGVLGFNTLLLSLSLCF